MKHKYQKWLLCLVIFIANQAYTEDSNNFSEVILSPKIISSEASSLQYEFAAEYLKPFLESVFIVEHGSLQTKKSKPLFNKPKIENGTVIVESPYIEKGQVLNSLKRFFSTKKVKSERKTKKSYVVGMKEKNKIMAGQNDIVFVAGINEDKYKEYVFIEPGVNLYHPTTKEYLGTEILIIGQGSLISRSEISALMIKNAKKSIATGALIMPNRSIQIPEKLQVSSPTTKHQGYILYIIGGSQRASNRNVVIVSVGERDGAKIGDLLTVKQPDLELKDPYKVNKQYKIPIVEPKGELVLYDVFHKVSIGLIVKSITDIQVLDQVE